jgi:cyclopentanol dehydrogenase
MSRVLDKVVVVTGAASGMGRAHSLLLAREGAHVVATDRDAAGGEATLEEIRRDGGSAIFVPHDVAREQDWAAVIATATDRYGRVDVLVNNAGIGLGKATVETTLGDWDRLNDINARGSFIGCREVIPIMQKAGGGSIINISSSWGLVGRAGFAAYSASKGAVRMMTKSLAAELAPYNIRVNSVHPGTIETALTKPVLTSAAAIDAIIGPQPMRRVGRPIDVSYVVLFLASDESTYVTGSELVIDGGYTAV